MARIAAAVVLAVLLGMACQAAPPASEDTEVSLLFSLTADGGRLEQAGGDDQYTLVLNGVDARTTQFTDRPARSAWTIPTAHFIDAWDSYFGDDPPNAALVEQEPDGTTDTLVLTLSAPVYDAAADELRYESRLLSDEQHPERLSGMIGRGHEQPPSTFGAASLFIDSVNGTWVATCFIQPYAQCGGAFMQGVDLTDADMRWAYLGATNLSGANLTRTRLDGAFLSGARLREANLTSTSLVGANLGGADLSDAIIAGDFSGANLRNADLTNANISWFGTNFKDVIYCNTTMPDGWVNDANC